MRKAPSSYANAATHDSMLWRAELNQARNHHAINAIEILAVNGIALRCSEIVSDFHPLGCSPPAREGRRDLGEMLTRCSGFHRTSAERSRQAYATTAR